MAIVHAYTCWPRGAWLVFCLLSLRQAQLLEDMQKFIQSFHFIFHMSCHFIWYMHAYNHAGHLLHVCSKSLGNYWMGSVHAPARTGNYSTPTRKLLQHALKTFGILWARVLSAELPTMTIAITLVVVVPIMSDAVDVKKGEELFLESTPRKETKRKDGSWKTDAAKAEKAPKVRAKAKRRPADWKS